MTDIPFIDVALRLTTAVVFGAVIGLDRDLRDKSIGMRTLALVGLGSAVAALAAIKAGDSDGFSRVAQGILAGIGFLGAGVILQLPSQGVVKGLTTAAAIWVTSAVGMMCALGHWQVAALATALAVAVLLADPLFKRILPLSNKGAAETDRADPQA